MAMMASTVQPSQAVRPGQTLRPKARPLLCAAAGAGANHGGATSRGRSAAVTPSALPSGDSIPMTRLLFALVVSVAGKLISDELGRKPDPPSAADVTGGEPAADSQQQQIEAMQEKIEQLTLRLSQVTLRLSPVEQATLILLMDKITQDAKATTVDTDEAGID